MYFDTTVVFRKFETKFNTANFQIQGQITRTNLIRLNPQSWAPATRGLRNWWLPSPL